MTSKESMTPELAKRIKAKLDKYPMVTNQDIGLMCGVSAATIAKFKNGGYDYLFAKSKEIKDDDVVSDRLRIIDDNLNNYFTAMYEESCSMKETLDSLANLVHVIASFCARIEKDKQYSANMIKQIIGVHDPTVLNETMKK